MGAEQGTRVGGGGPVLVTGAGGFLGRLIVRRLREAGFRVVEGLRSSLGGADEVALDLFDAEGGRRAIGTLRPSVVVHAAAIGDPRKCEADPELARRVNVAGTAAVGGGWGAAGGGKGLLWRDEAVDRQRGRNAQTPPH